MRHLPMFTVAVMATTIAACFSPLSARAQTTGTQVTGAGGYAAVCLAGTDAQGNPIPCAATTSNSSGAQATGASSVAVGEYTLASGTDASAFGPLAQATGAASTAIGQHATATVDFSTALGRGHVGAPVIRWTYLPASAARGARKKSRSACASGCVRVRCAQSVRGRYYAAIWAAKERACAARAGK